MEPGSLAAAKLGLRSGLEALNRLDSNEGCPTSPRLRRAFFASFNLFYGLPFVASNGSEEWRRRWERPSDFITSQNAKRILPTLRRRKERSDWRRRWERPSDFITSQNAKRILPTLRRRKERSDWRRRWESNPRMTVLQTIALPLGDSAVTGAGGD